MRDIVLPDAKPAYEWIFGRALQKVSPKRDHALTQGALWAALHAWAGASGEVGTEWRFRITPPGEEARVFVPDVAYVAGARFATYSRAQKQEPALAPDVAVEVRSPDDRADVLAEKTRVYLAAGTSVVMLVDPRAETVELHDASRTRVFRPGENVEHEALPCFALDVERLFAPLR